MRSMPADFQEALRNVLHAITSCYEGAIPRSLRANVIALNVYDEPSVFLLCCEVVHLRSS